MPLTDKMTLARGPAVTVAFPRIKTGGTPILNSHNIVRQSLLR